MLTQALLIMSFLYETLDDHKNAYHWVGLAVTLAYQMGLNSDVPGTRTPGRTRSLRRRLWWCCFIRDRLVSLGFGLPARIKDDDFDVAMVDEGDLKVDNTSDAVCAMSENLAFTDELRKQRLLAQMFVAKAELCVRIGVVLSICYPPVRSRPGTDPRMGSKCARTPRGPLSKVSLEWIASCDSQLLAWERSLPRSCRYQPPGDADADAGQTHEAVAIRNLLHLGYHITMLVLHVPVISSHLDPVRPGGEHSATRQTSMDRARTAATRIASLAAELQSIRLGRYMPTNGITAFSPALIFNLLDGGRDDADDDDDDDDDAMRSAPDRPAGPRATGLPEVLRLCAGAGSIRGFFDTALANVVETISSGFSLPPPGGGGDGNDAAPSAPSRPGGIGAADGDSGSSPCGPGLARGGGYHDYEAPGLGLVEAGPGSVASQSTFEDIGLFGTPPGGIPGGLDELDVGWKPADFDDLFGAGIGDLEGCMLEL